MKGILYGIGVGPGDPELITLKAVRIINECSVIFSPITSKNATSVALTVAKCHINKNAEILTPVFPMTTDAEKLNKHWDEASKLIIQSLEKGISVAFLTIGDPMLYSTFMYVKEIVEKRGYNTECVSGVTSFCAAANRLKIPLVETDEKLCIIPAFYDCENLDFILESFETIVFMKVSNAFDKLLDILENKQLADNAYLVSRVGLEDEAIEKNIKKLRGNKINYLSMVIVKKRRNS